MKKQTRFIVVVSALLALSYAVSLTAQVGFADEPAVVTAPAQPVKEPTATNETGGDAAPKPKGILKKGGKKGKKGGVNWGDEKGGSLGQERSITVGQNKKELSLKIIENGIKDAIDQNDLTQLIESDPLAKLLEQEKEKIKDTFEKDIESARERLKEIKKEIGKGPKRKAPTTEEDGTFRDRLSQAYDNRTKLLQEQKKLQAEIAEKVKERDASIAKLEAEQPVRKEALNKLIEAQKKILKLKAEIIKANPQTVEDFAKLTDKINDAFENETENPDAKADIKQIVAQKAFKVVTQTDALTTDPNGVELIKTALEATTAGNIRQLVEATKALTDPVAQATAKSLIDQHLKDLTTKAADRIIEITKSKNDPKTARKMEKAPESLTDKPLMELVDLVNEIKQLPEKQQGDLLAHFTEQIKRIETPDPSEGYTGVPEKTVSAATWVELKVAAATLQELPELVEAIKKIPPTEVKAEDSISRDLWANEQVDERQSARTLRQLKSENNQMNEAQDSATRVLNERITELISQAILSGDPEQLTTVVDAVRKLPALRDKAFVDEQLEKESILQLRDKVGPKDKAEFEKIVRKIIELPEAKKFARKINVANDASDKDVLESIDLSYFEQGLSTKDYQKFKVLLDQIKKLPSLNDKAVVDDGFISEGFSRALQNATEGVVDPKKFFTEQVKKAIEAQDTKLLKILADDIQNSSVLSTADRIALSRQANWKLRKIKEEDAPARGIWDSIKSTFKSLAARFTKQAPPTEEEQRAIVNAKTTYFETDEFKEEIGQTIKTFLGDDYPSDPELSTLVNQLEVDLINSFYADKGALGDSIVKVTKEAFENNPAITQAEVNEIIKQHVVDLLNNSKSVETILEKQKTRTEKLIKKGVLKKELSKPEPENNNQELDEPDLVDSNAAALEKEIAQTAQRALNQGDAQGLKALAPDIIAANPDLSEAELQTIIEKGFAKVITDAASVPDISKLPKYAANLVNVDRSKLGITISSIKTALQESGLTDDVIKNSLETGLTDAIANAIARKNGAMLEVIADTLETDKTLDPSIRDTLARKVQREIKKIETEPKEDGGMFERIRKGLSSWLSGSGKKNPKELSIEDQVKQALEADPIDIQALNDLIEKTKTANDERGLVEIYDSLMDPLGSGKTVSADELKALTDKIAESLNSFNRRIPDLPIDLEARMIELDVSPKEALKQAMENDDAKQIIELYKEIVKNRADSRLLTDMANKLNELDPEGTAEWQKDLPTGLKAEMLSLKQKEVSDIGTELNRLDQEIDKARSDKDISNVLDDLENLKEQINTYGNETQKQGLQELQRRANEKEKEIKTQEGQGGQSGGLDGLFGDNDDDDGDDDDDYGLDALEALVGKAFKASAPTSTNSGNKFAEDLANRIIDAKTTEELDTLKEALEEMQNELLAEDENDPEAETIDTYLTKIERKRKALEKEALNRALTENAEQGKEGGQESEDDSQKGGTQTTGVDDTNNGSQSDSSSGGTGGTQSFIEKVRQALKNGDVDTVSSLIEEKGNEETADDLNARRVVEGDLVDAYRAIMNNRDLTRQQTSELTDDIARTFTGKSPSLDLPTGLKAAVYQLENPSSTGLKHHEATAGKDEGGGDGGSNDGDGDDPTEVEE